MDYKVGAVYLVELMGEIAWQPKIKKGDKFNAVYVNIGQFVFSSSELGYAHYLIKGKDNFMVIKEICLPPKLSHEDHVTENEKELKQDEDSTENFLKLKPSSISFTEENETLLGFPWSPKEMKSITVEFK